MNEGKKRNIDRIAILFVGELCSSGGSSDPYVTVHGSPATGTYVHVGDASLTSQTLRLYKINSTFHMVYENTELCDSLSHVSGTGEKSLCIMYDRTILGKSVIAYNTSLGVTVSSEIMDGIVSLGVGSNKMSVGHFYASEEPVGYIQSNTPTGYYKLVPGRTYWELKADCHDNSSPYSNIYYLDMPYGTPAIYTVYSTNSVNWDIR